MTDATILIIEGKHADVPVFAAALEKKGFTVEIAPSGSKAVKLIKELLPEVVVLNAASLRSSGVRICQAIKEQDEKQALILVIDPTKDVPKETADVILKLPFTVQKLVNRIKPLLPSDGTNTLQAGPIRLDPDHRRVRSLGKSARLTPRLVMLLQVLIEHRGEVVEREDLFKRVWETDYTGDTRTLDVHISWLRKAIELDPDNPRLLKTIRGVGYRLDV